MPKEEKEGDRERTVECLFTSNDHMTCHSPPGQVTILSGVDLFVFFRFFHFFLREEELEYSLR
jgi:hypothetical protein